MAVKSETEPDAFFNGRPVSTLGLRLRKIREQIAAAAARGETRLLSKQELERELNELRNSDSNLH